MISGENLLETPGDAGPPPRGIVSRWIMELRLADQEEADWRGFAKKAITRYRNENAPKTRKGLPAFNILWSNTETLRPALYNSAPIPDVRRRFADKDPVAKLTSEVLERCLTFSADDEDFDNKAKFWVNDILLTGRGIARVRYMPTIMQVGPEGKEPIEHEAQEGPDEEVDWETCPYEVVHWDDFRRGPGRSWREVHWIAFRHRLTKEQLEEKFGKALAETLPLEEVNLGDVKDDYLDPTVFKRAVVWEIWNKDDKEVIWINQAFPSKPLLIQEDPLGLKDFYPIPEPILAIESNDTLIPLTPYSMYEKQAIELDLVTERINKITKAMKVRGAYAGHLQELDRISKADDNEFIALENALAMSEIGGLDKAIYHWPIDVMAAVLQQLLQFRESIKQTIYEITGISDIIRGASNPQETATAQSIKSQWGSLRLQRLQREVQRFCRDLFRLKAEIIAKHFQPQTIIKMSGLNLPTNAQKQAVQHQMMMLQMRGQQAQMQGDQQGMQQVQIGLQQIQQQTQDMMQTPAWEDVLKLLESDTDRFFRVDVETDSTVQNQVNVDQKAITELMAAIGNFMQAMLPAMQMQIIPHDAAKAMLITIVRKLKMGRQVEDALENIQPPPQQPSPDMIKAQLEAKKADNEDANKKAELQLRDKEITGNLALKKQELDLTGKIKDAELSQNDKHLSENLTQQLAIHKDTHGLNNTKMMRETPNMNAVMNDTMQSMVPHIQEASHKAAGEALTNALQQLLPAIEDHIQKTTDKAHAELAKKMPKNPRPMGITRKRDKAGRMTHGVVTYDDGSTQEIAVQ